MKIKHILVALVLIADVFAPTSDEIQLLEEGRNTTYSSNSVINMEEPAFESQELDILNSRLDALRHRIYVNKIMIHAVSFTLMALTTYKILFEK